MALRKASAYSKKYARPYTRKSRKKGKSYIKTVPQQKIVKFQMGSLKKFEKGLYKYTLILESKENVQIRDNALESIRQFVHKNLDKELTGNYYLGIKVFPHHIIRENKALTGAGADRMQTGMQKSFGTTIGRSAIVKKGKEILVIGVSTEKSARFAREVLHKIKPKLPCTTRIITEKKA
jgi:large subunit ribosomal protein L10e